MRYKINKFVKIVHIWYHFCNIICENTQIHIFVHSLLCILIYVYEIYKINFNQKFLKECVYVCDKISYIKM